MFFVFDSAIAKLRDNRFIECEADTPATRSGSVERDLTGRTSTC